MLASQWGELSLSAFSRQMCTCVSFGIRARNGLGREVANPWYRPWLVAAEVLEGSQYDPDGEEEILYRPVPPERGEG